MKESLIILSHLSDSSVVEPRRQLSVKSWPRDRNREMSESYVSHFRSYFANKRRDTYSGNCSNLLALRSRVGPISSGIAGGYFLKLSEWTNRSQIYSAGREWRSRQLSVITATLLISSSVNNLFETFLLI